MNRVVERGFLDEFWRFMRTESIWDVRDLNGTGLGQEDPSDELKGAGPTATGHGPERDWTRMCGDWGGWDTGGTGWLGWVKTSRVGRGQTDSWNGSWRNYLVSMFNSMLELYGLFCTFILRYPTKYM